MGNGNLQLLLGGRVHAGRKGKAPTSSWGFGKRELHSGKTGLAYAYETGEDGLSRGRAKSRNLLKKKRSTEYFMTTGLGDFPFHTKE